MKLAIPTTALALALGSTALGPALAQEAQTDQQTGQQPADQMQADVPDATAPPADAAGQETLQAQGTGQEAAQPQAGEFGREHGDRFVSELMGMPVYAPPAGEQVALDGGAAGTIDAAELAAFVPVGWVSDVLVGSDVQPRAILVSLGDPATFETGAGMGAGAGTGVGGTAGVAMQEVAIAADRIRFLNDATVATLSFAVIDMDVAELQSAPLVDRLAGMPAGADPAMQGMGGGWMMGRAPMGAPTVAMEGYTPVPVNELSIDNLLGSSVFGADGQSIGSVNDVVLDPAAGGVDYVVVDVGGFLGIGSRSVALGLEEMTILRDAGWNDLQVHVAADQTSLEAMPEYQSQN